MAGTIFDVLFGQGKAMTTATLKRPQAVKSASRRVDLSKLSDRQIEALPEDVFLASLDEKTRRLCRAAFRLKGAFKAGR